MPAFTDPPEASQPEKQAGGRGNLMAWLIFIAAAVVVAAIFEFSGSGDTGTNQAAVGRRLPQLELKPLTGGGRPVSLRDLQGRVTLVDFWGTWCPPCAAELPHIAMLATKFAGADFQVLAVSCGMDPRSEQALDLSEQTESFLKGFKINLPTYFDPGAYTRNGVEMIAGSIGYPTTIVLDRRGVIRGMWVGYRAGDERKLEKLIAKLLAEESDSK
jgi:thiol-disulfide isomerase/thioredoxin